MMWTFNLLVITLIGLSSASLPDALSHIAFHENGKYLDDIKHLVAIDGISALPSTLPKLQQAAKWLEQRIQTAGLENVKVMPTPDNGPRPVVYADWLHAGPGKPTALIYGHYDVQPVTPLDLWITPPFQATIRDGALYGRGSSDDKGNLLLPIQAAEAILSSTNGTFPINLKFLIEGEEEVGSPYLGRFLKQHVDLFKADFAISADGGQAGIDQPSISLGLRGALAMEIEITTVKKDLHSGFFGGFVGNAARAMSQLLESLHISNDNGTKVAVEGFYDKVRPPTPEDQDHILAMNYDEHKEIVEALGAVEVHTEPGYTALESNWLRPTLEITGMASGFAGDGIKTIIPGKAVAKLAARLVPDQDPEEIAKLIEAHAAKHHPPACNVTLRELGFSVAAYVMKKGEGANVAAAKVLEKVMGGKKPKYLRDGATIPAMSLFEQELGIKMTKFAFALPDDDPHAPNERFQLAMARMGREAWVRLFYELGGEEGEKRKEEENDKSEL